MTCYHIWCLGVGMLLSTPFIVSQESTKITLQTVEHAQNKVFCDLGCGCTNWDFNWFVNCEGKSIANLPKGIKYPPEVNEVSFHNNRIHNITTDIFSSGDNVKILDLSNNRLSVIEGWSFSKLNAMTTLHLSHNNLTEVSNDMLLSLTNLETLEIGHNKIRKISKGAFAHTPALRVLHLQHNSLKILSDTSFQYLENLEKLNLQGNSLMTLSSILFVHTPHLQWISLADNTFKEVPKLALHRASTLSSLDMSGNLLRTIEEDTFSLLVNVTHLSLNNMHQLTRVEKHAFVKLTRLRVLSCSSNTKLTYLHPEILNAFQTNKIEDRIHVVLNNNGLRNLPEPTEIELWANGANFDFSDNPWRCDCNLQWMAKIKTNNFTLRCETPWTLHGRSIATLSEEDLICDEHWVFSTVIMVLAAIVAFTMLAIFLVVTACTKTPLGQYVKAKVQFDYAKVIPRKESVDLEWDPTVEF